MLYIPLLPWNGALYICSTSQIYRPEPVYPMKAERDAARYYDEMLRLLNEILAVLKENNAMLREHNSVVSSIDERVRKINVNTSNLR